MAPPALHPDRSRIFHHLRGRYRLAPCRPQRRSVYQSVRCGDL